MSFRNEFAMLAISMVLAGGCDQGAPADLDTADRAFKVCNPDSGCTSSNCDDINQPDQGPGSDFSMAIPGTTSYRYKLTGFYRDAKSNLRVRGFVVSQPGLVYKSGDGTVKYAVIDNLPQPVVDLSASATKFTLTYCTVQTAPCPASRQQTLSDSLLKGAQLVVTVPAEPGGRETLAYTLSFDSAAQTLDLVQPSSQDVVGYSFTYTASGLLGAPRTLCAGPNGVAQRTLFYQSASWDPQSFVKSADRSAITVSCELGAIAACMSWGYKPWENTSFQKQDQTKDDWHATCVNAKTANYCGDGYAWTKYGTAITVSDPLSPPVMFESLKYVEALWTTKGAACVNAANRRIATLPWSTSSCYATMPDCSTFDRSSFFGTGIPVPNP